MLIGLVIASAIFTACKKDKDDEASMDDKTTPTTANCSLVGDWKLTKKADFFCDDSVTEEVYTFSTNTVSIACPNVSGDPFIWKYKLSSDCKTYSSEDLLEADKFNNFKITELTETTFKYNGLSYS